MEATERRPVSSRRQDWLQEKGIDLEAVEAALLKDDTVEDCMVARETGSGETTLVAYVVAPQKARREKHLKRPMPAWKEFLGKPIRRYIETASAG